MIDSHIRNEDKEKCIYYLRSLQSSEAVDKGLREIQQTQSCSSHEKKHAKHPYSILKYCAGIDDTKDL